MSARLSTQEKAAVVVLGMDEDIAAEVLGKIDEATLKKLVECVGKMGTVPVEEIESTFDEFVGRMQTPVLASGSGDYLRKLTQAAIGDDRARRVFGEELDLTNSLDALRSARASTLAELLLEEHPQLAAVIVSQLPREQAAKVMLAMPPDRQVDLLARVGELGEIPAQAVAAASDALVRALDAAGGLTRRDQVHAFDGVVFAAELLNEIAPQDTERLLGGIEESNPKLAPKIRDAMFTFEDLIRIDSRQISQLMREVNADTLLVALKQASEALREHFFAAVSSRAAAQMREDFAVMKPMRLSDIERGQREIVEIASRLAAEGRLTLPGKNEEML